MGELTELMTSHPDPTRKNRFAATGLLILTAFIWGMCFVAQRSSMEHMGPFLFNGLRQVLGALTLLVVMAGISLLARLKKRGRFSQAAGGDASVTEHLGAEAAKRNTELHAQKRLLGTRSLIRSGIICGVVLFVASNLQQVGMVTTTASKAGFITTLYIVLVPLVGIVFAHKTHWNTWLSVGIAVVGLYLLCISESFKIASGDLLLLICALFWALHILFVDRYVHGLSQREVMKLCVVQFSVTALLSLICAPLLDRLFVDVPFSLYTLYEVLPEIAYAGVLSTAVAFTLAATGQKYAKPSVAAVVMSLESVFALLGGAVLLNEIMTGRELTGCVLMFAAVILVQLSFTKNRKKPQSG